MNQDIIFAMTGVLAVLLGGLVVLIPVLGLTIRFALRPLVDAWIQLRKDGALESETDLLRRQVHLLESELQQMQHSVQSLTEAQEFQRRLEEKVEVNR